ncbi:MAG TPA: DUF2806 domain-containing protein [Phycisphaerae bacterium]|nr:DUF2806 domain-containing protein [Phycisphaerae bacterium]
MAEGTSIINLGELSKPATVLIEKISDAVGGIFRPYQIRRIAEAEADAEMIAAKNEIKLTALHHRALDRFLNEEAKKQQNIEEITARAIPQIEEKALPQKMDDDWITNFFDKCRIVSDTEMQTLWSKVLAGEANDPGHFSKRTVSLLGSLDKKDAKLFQSLCNFVWEIGDPVPLVFKHDDRIYNDVEINFGTLTHLDSVGLINFDALAGFARTGLPKRVAIPYYSTFFGLEFESESNNQIDLGHVLLSQSGMELASICGSQPNAAFLEYVLNILSERGLKPSSPYPRRAKGM